jgi:DnaJ-class molecular chaperone
MRTPCITCDGRGTIAPPRCATRGRHGGTAYPSQPCHTCGGEGSYHWLKGPGVDHTKVHGTGLK